MGYLLLSFYSRSAEGPCEPGKPKTACKQRGTVSETSHLLMQRKACLGHSRADKAVHACVKSQGSGKSGTGLRCWSCAKGSCGPTMKFKLGTSEISKSSGSAWENQSDGSGSPQQNRKWKQKQTTTIKFKTVRAESTQERDVQRQTGNRLTLNELVWPKGAQYVIGVNPLVSLLELGA